MTLTAPPRHSRSHQAWHLVRHYLEMVVAMVAGMVVLGRVGPWVGPGLSGHVAGGALVMATDMAMGMGGWMRFRGPSGGAIGMMPAAMYLPFLVLLVPLAAGAITGG